MLKQGLPQLLKSRDSSLPGRRTRLKTPMAPRSTSASARESTAPLSNIMCPCGTINCTAIFPLTSMCWSTAGLAAPTYTRGAVMVPPWSVEGDTGKCGLEDHIVRARIQKPDRR